MESTSIQYLKKTKTSAEIVFKKSTPSLLTRSSTKRNKKLNCSFELPILCVKRSKLPNRQDIYSYSIYNNHKKELSSSSDYNREDYENDGGVSSSSSNNFNSKSMNNFSKVVVTLKIKKETSMKSRFHSDEHLPLLKTAINNYSNDYNVNIGKKGIYNNNTDQNYRQREEEEEEDDDDFDDDYITFRSNQGGSEKRESKVMTSEPGSIYQIEENEEENDYTKMKIVREKSFAWMNFEKVLNKTKNPPENPPATPNLF